MSRSIQEIIQFLETQPEEIWISASPITDANNEQYLLEVEETCQMQLPKDYKTFIRYFKGGVLIGPENMVDLFTTGNLLDCLQDPTQYGYAAQELPSMIFFGYDAGPMIYFFDPINYLGRGAWATYVAYTPRRFEYSQYIAPDFTSFLEFMLSDQSVLELPDLKEEGWSQGPD